MTKGQLKKRVRGISFSFLLDIFSDNKKTIKKAIFRDEKVAFFVLLPFCVVYYFLNVFIFLVIDGDVVIKQNVHVAFQCGRVSVLRDE